MATGIVSRGRLGIYHGPCWESLRFTTALRLDPAPEPQQNLNPLPALGLKTRSNLLKMELNFTQAQFWSPFGHFARLPNELGDLP